MLESTGCDVYLPKDHLHRMTRSSDSGLLMSNAGPGANLYSNLTWRLNVSQ